MVTRPSSGTIVYRGKDYPHSYKLNLPLQRRRSQHRHKGILSLNITRRCCLSLPSTALFVMVLLESPSKCKSGFIPVRNNPSRPKNLCSPSSFQFQFYRRGKFDKLGAFKTPFSTTEKHDPVDGTENEEQILDMIVAEDSAASTAESAPAGADWTIASSMGSFLLQRKKEEENQIQRIRKVLDDKAVRQSAPGSEETKERRQRVEIIDMTSSQDDDNVKSRSKAYQKKENEAEVEAKDPSLVDDTIGSVSLMDEELARELDDAVTPLSKSTTAAMKEIKVLPVDSSLSVVKSRARSASLNKSNRLALETEKVKTGLFWRKHKQVEHMPLSDPEHTDRIGRDMRHLAVSIASSVDSTSQWRVFCEEGGGLVPMLQCIRHGALSVEEGGADIYDEDSESFSVFTPQHEESFMVACTACRALRDICAISPEISAVITEGILRADAAWSMSVPNGGGGKDCSSGGLISDLVILLKHANESERFYRRWLNRQKGDLRLRISKGAFGRSSRRVRRETRRRCSLYVVQLLLAMVIASDAAVNALRTTAGLTDAVKASSSFAPKERSRRWIRYPLEIVKALFSSKNGAGSSSVQMPGRRSQRPFIAAASIGDDLAGKVQGTANQVLAAIGHNEWIPKIPGQKGLRILCLDGGGTRGIAAITTLRSVVDAIGGIEVCDAFDIIAGTSTGAIIAFLVSLRRETSKQAKRRYDSLIKRIFVKSALSTPMLVFTTATYDEAPFMTVMQEILGDNSMLDSRADPSVPLTFGISSKMSSNPTQLCLFRNYNYGGGELPDAFVIDPEEARINLGLKPENFSFTMPTWDRAAVSGKCAPRTGEGSRHPGSFRVLQRVAMRASTAAPTVFKPVLMSGELYCDGGIVASNPTAVAIHEARILFPDVPIEMVVSCGTGGFIEEKSAPRIGWDGIIGQIVQSATDGEQTHHILEDILGEGSTAVLGRSSVSKTRYFRLNPLIGMPNDFPIDGTDPEKLEELSKITQAYLNEDEQRAKLKEIGDILEGKLGWKRLFSK